MKEWRRAQGRASYRFNFDVDWVDEEELGKMKERKLAKKNRKEAKHVANVTVTPNQDQEYDIDDVVKKLEECCTKPGPKRNRKRKRRKIKMQKVVKNRRWRKHKIGIMTIYK